MEIPAHEIEKVRTKNTENAGPPNFPLKNGVFFLKHSFFFSSLFSSSNNLCSESSVLDLAFHSFDTIVPTSTATNLQESISITIQGDILDSQHDATHGQEEKAQQEETWDHFLKYSTTVELYIVNILNFQTKCYIIVPLLYIPM